jgi:hypothetical protein
MGGTARWKMQIFVWLAILTMIVFYAIIKQKKENYQQLWKDVKCLKERCGCK